MNKSPWSVAYELNITEDMIKRARLDRFYEELYGPEEMLINDEGETVSYQEWKDQFALDIMNKKYDWTYPSYEIIFIRKDGYSLATNSELEEYAYNLYKNDWIGCARQPFGDPNGLVTIEEYEKHKVK